MYALNNVTTQNDYAAATRLDCTGAIRFNLTVANAAIYLRAASAQGAGGPGGAGPEVFFPPGFYNRGQAVDRLEVRSALAGAPAQVTIEAVERADDGPG